MEDRPVHESEIRGPIKIVCNHCGASNPAKAYCCITCFKVLRPKAKTDFLQMAVRPSIALVLVFCVLVLTGLFAMKRWIDKLDARVQMDLKTSDYNISVTADKRSKTPAAADAVPSGEPDVNDVEAPSAPVPAAPAN